MGNYTCVVAIPGVKQSVQGPPTPLVLRGDGKFPPSSFLTELNMMSLQSFFNGESL